MPDCCASAVWHKQLKESCQARGLARQMWFQSWHRGGTKNPAYLARPAEDVSRDAGQWQRWCCQLCLPIFMPCQHAYPHRSLLTLSPEFSHAQQHCWSLCSYPVSLLSISSHFAPHWGAQTAVTASCVLCTRRNVLGCGSAMGMGSLCHQKCSAGQYHCSLSNLSSSRGQEPQLSGPKADPGLGTATFTLIHWQVPGGTGVS